MRYKTNSWILFTEIRFDIIYIYIYMCVCVCVCVCTHTHKVRAKCSFLVLYRVAYSDTNLQRGSEEIKCLLSLATITIQAVYPRIIQVPLVQVTFFYSPPSPPSQKKQRNDSCEHYWLLRYGWE